MKKYLSLLLLIILIPAIGCESKDLSQHSNSGPESHETFAVLPGNVDVDLTVLSSTMLFAEVNNMMTTPVDYMGKSVKISGPYYASFYDETGLYYHYVIIEDASACCTQGLEFVWNGNHFYPDDYPEDDMIIEVIGVFGSYDELGQTYYYLAVDDISITG